MNSWSDPNANDSTYQELNRIINDQSNCFAKEAQSNELTSANLAMAAHAVLATALLRRNDTWFRTQCLLIEADDASSRRFIGQ
jgi:hypothetical protein